MEYRIGDQVINDGNEGYCEWSIEKTLSILQESRSRRGFQLTRQAAEGILELRALCGDVACEDDEDDCE